MKYRLLGKSALRVSEAALGTMTFGDERGWESRKPNRTRIPTGYLRERNGSCNKIWRHVGSLAALLISESLKHFAPEQIVATL
jgi:hypothetical protein